MNKQRPYGIPEKLPCGCRMKRGKVRVCTQVMRCKNGFFVCRCGDWWTWDYEKEDFVPVPHSVVAGKV